MAEGRVGIMGSSPNLVHYLHLVLDEGGLDVVPIVLPSAIAWQAAQRFLEDDGLRVAVYIASETYGASRRSYQALAGALPGCRIIPATLNKAGLEEAVGATGAVEFDGSFLGTKNTRLLAVLRVALRRSAPEPDGEPAPLG